MQIEDKLVSLGPGMAVTVEINTGSRRVISYLLSPLGPDTGTKAPARGEISEVCGLGAVFHDGAEKRQHQRNLIELKQFRRIAMRYDKLGDGQ